MTQTAKASTSVSPTALKHSGTAVAFLGLTALAAFFGFAAMLLGAAAAVGLLMYCVGAEVEEERET